MLPQMQILALYGGGAVATLLDSPLVARRRWAAFAIRGLAGASLLAGLRLSAMVIATMLGDARYDAEAYMRVRFEPGDQVETYGKNVYLPRFPTNVRVQRVGAESLSSRNPMPGIEELQAPLGSVRSRSPRWIVVSTGYAWQFLRENEPDKDGHAMPASQRRSLVDADATGHVRALFSGAAGYSTAHVSHYSGSWLLPPRALHASLACDIFVFEDTRASRSR
jgi:hypothetical protein